MPAAPAATPSAPRLAGLAAVAAVLQIGCDALARLAGWSSPPHLLLRFAPEIFQWLSPLAVSIATGAVNGVIAVIALLAVEATPAMPPSRRLLTLGIVLFAFWVLAEGLFALAWLSAPTGWVLGGLAFGLPRSLLVAWALSRLERPGSRPRPASPTSRAGAGPASASRP